LDRPDASGSTDPISGYGPARNEGVNRGRVYEALYGLSIGRLFAIASVL
jgi:hypothetical protein